MKKHYGPISSNDLPDRIAEIVDDYYDRSLEIARAFIHQYGLDAASSLAMFVSAHLTACSIHFNNEIPESDYEECIESYKECVEFNVKNSIKLLKEMDEK